MRYIAKGKCKRTETRIKWNQTGNTGQQGFPGQNFYVQDATGKVIGKLISYFPSDLGGVAGLDERVAVLHNSRLWMLSMNSVAFLNTSGYTGKHWGDEKLTQPMAYTRLALNTEQSTYVWENKVYIANGTPKPVPEVNPFCAVGRRFLDGPAPGSDWCPNSENAGVVSLSEITPLTYTPSLKIISDTP